MTKLDRLKKEALKTCTFREHHMTRFATVCLNKRAWACCVRCGRIVYVDINPLPNDVEIGGEAIALNCV